MLFLKNRSKFHIVFFKSRIKSSSGIGILFGLIAQMAIDPEYQTPVIQMINKLLLFIPIGMLFKILIEEIDNKDRYYLNISHQMCHLYHSQMCRIYHS